MATNPHEKPKPQGKSPQRLEITAQNTELCIFRTTIYHIYKAREQSSDPTRDDVRVKCLYCVFNVTEEREREQEREEAVCELDMLLVFVLIGMCMCMWSIYGVLLKTKTNRVESVNRV